HLARNDTPPRRKPGPSDMYTKVPREYWTPAPAFAGASLKAAGATHYQDQAASASIIPLRLTLLDLYKNNIRRHNERDHSFYYSFIAGTCGVCSCIAGIPGASATGIAPAAANCRPRERSSSSRADTALAY